MPSWLPFPLPPSRLGTTTIIITPVTLTKQPTPASSAGATLEAYAPVCSYTADPRYPIGPPPSKPGTESRQQAIKTIADLPELLSKALADLSAIQLDTSYRDGGWTLRQLTHHVADSHLNAYARLRLALTEDWPVIKPYRQAEWAELSDARSLSVKISLDLLAPLHTRWTILLASLDEAAWLRGYAHPENGRTTIEEMTALYSWHGRHHTAHVLALRERLGW